MVRWADMEMTFSKEDLLLTVSWKQEASYVGPHGEVRDQPGGRSPGKCRQEPLMWVPRVGMGKAVWAGSELASLNHFRGPWGIGAVPLSGT